MKVNSNNPGIEVLAYLKQIRQQQQPSHESNAQPGARPAPDSDKVVLSERAREAQQAARSLEGASDVRHEKVSQIKLEVEKGTYKVVGPKVATGILRESLENDLILQKISR